MDLIQVIHARECKHLIPAETLNFLKRSTGAFISNWEIIAQLRDDPFVGHRRNFASNSELWFRDKEELKAGIFGEVNKSALRLPDGVSLVHLETGEPEAIIRERFDYSAGRMCIEWIPGKGLGIFGTEQGMMDHEN